MANMSLADYLIQQPLYGAAAPIAQRGTQTTPVLSPMEGLARALQGGIGGWMMGEGIQNAKQERTDDQKALASAMEKYATDPVGARQILASRPNLSDQASALMMQDAGLQKQMDLEAYKHRLQNDDYGGMRQSFQAANSGGPGGDYGAAIAGIESKGQPNGGYGAVGPAADAKGSRAYGKYQVMDYNIGPWTQEILGKPMSPQEFLANPQAQDAVFKAKFGQYVQQTGNPQQAAAMWFSGKPNTADNTTRDVNGMTPAQYSQQFAQSLGQSGQPQQVGSAPPLSGGQGDGTLAQAQPSSNGPPEVPRPVPTRAQIAKYEAMIGPKGLNGQQAQQMLEAEINQQWQHDRQRALEVWKEQEATRREREKADIALGQAGPLAIIKDRVSNYENKTRPGAMAAVNDINAIHSIRQVLDSGAFTGTGADAKTMVAKAGELLGIPSDKAVNTQVLSAVLAKRVLAAAGGTLGTGFSNADRDFVERASGGQVSMDEAAMRRLADIGERQARQTLKQHEDDVGRIKGLPGMGSFSADYFAVPQAPTYEDWSKANPSPLARAGSAAPQPQRQIPTVQTPDEARKLPRGTQFKTPDGRILTVP